MALEMLQQEAVAGRAREVDNLPGCCCCCLRQRWLFLLAESALYYCCCLFEEASPGAPSSSQWCLQLSQAGALNKGYFKDFHRMEGERETERGRDQAETGAAGWLGEEEEAWGEDEEDWRGG